MCLCYFVWFWESFECSVYDEGCGIWCCVILYYIELFDDCIWIGGLVEMLFGYCLGFWEGFDDDNGFWVVCGEVSCVDVFIVVDVEFVCFVRD